MTTSPIQIQAQERDAADPLAAFRQQFLIPHDDQGRDWAYFCGNSLGLQPRAVRAALAHELDCWGGLAVEGHFRGELPWMDYHEFVREDLALVAGARPGEVVAMNSLSTNLHLLMVSFYRPTRSVRHPDRGRRVPSDRMPWNRRSASTVSIRPAT